MKMTLAAGGDGATNKIGMVLHAPIGYDVLVWLRTFGRERALREKILGLVPLEPGQSVLDVGCGTGTLAVMAKGRVGPSGRVQGVDASPEMIARAERRAAKAGVEVRFRTAAAQALPFADAHFDVVTTTLMLHHLPRQARPLCIAELRRVVKPGGRVLAVDFGPGRSKGGLMRFHRHGHSHLRDVLAAFEQAGFTQIESGALGLYDLQFVVAKAPLADAGFRPNP